VDNQWLPLTPGTRLVWDGSAVEDGTPVKRRSTSTVTDMTKVIAGITTRVVYDQDFDDGKITEAEIAFFAQDADGTVWKLGQYPELFEEEKFTGAPNLWITGQDDAMAGIAMPAQPQPNAPSYSQGYSPDIDFLDCATISQTGQRVCAPTGCYTDVMIVDESSPFDPDGGIQRKYHAPGVGVVNVGAVDDPEAETLALTELTHLDTDAMAQLRDTVQAMDTRAHAASAIYRTTAPVRQADR
jgi:hypothetical protein